MVPGSEGTSLLSLESQFMHMDTPILPCGSSSDIDDCNTTLHPSDHVVGRNGVIIVVSKTAPVRICPVCPSFTAAPLQLFQLNLKDAIWMCDCCCFPMDSENDTVDAFTVQIVDVKFPSSSSMIPMDELSSLDDSGSDYLSASNAGSSTTLDSTSLCSNAKNDDTSFHSVNNNNIKEDINADIDNDNDNDDDDGDGDGELLDVEDVMEDLDDDFDALFDEVDAF